MLCDYRCKRSVIEVAGEDEIRELKETLHKLEQRVNSLTEESKRRRSGWSSFAIGFLIVFVVILISIGVLQFVTSPN
ncbi:hypothetical protein D3C78_1577960 [compost metagenome]